jgi:23S rRNA pseudouridine2457 synthase
MGTPVKQQKSKQYILFFKPYGVLCQFTDGSGRKTLKDFGPFPADVYSVGRLDLDSEGLILLTNDHDLNHRLTDPRFEHTRSYLVQVEGIPSAEDLARLRKGVIIQGIKTRPAEVSLLDVEPGIPPRIPPIRFRKSIPTSWIAIMLREGRNRQIRRMTASVGFPTLRLMRTTIGKLSLEGLKAGQSRKLSDEEVRGLWSVRAAYHEASKNAKK